MRVLTCADSGVLVEVADLAEVIALRAALRARPIPGVTDVVPAARTLLLRIEPGTDPDGVAAAVTGLPLAPGTGPDSGDTVTIPVFYDGEDLDDVAELTGLTRCGVVEAHTNATWTVAFCGFAPGFGYMVGDDPRLHVPRRGEARTRVPAGSVALAGEFAGVYPRSSPGGWQLLGRTEAPIWDLDRNPPGLLRPGVRVRFTDAEAS
ncbi:5-oxoprolinase subunit B family protein [Nocardiopsis dassonvillei]|uniref:Allophanate hydrolase subunit 1 n=1 Tax=Nocardiopsis dassonvillei (strain ATCC 23218 / DSM 43111 / CIP 107115 / JCM 7437 / KCTC 9190 / NBRC 14626 / NCTC 10488 / NRRL B-5397 / IMRU 509) TaxID=446468 RepID=D7B4G3_NOCDD|nr:allophanate hydrolase subunit 1 [Nocardiopsis dassonvillei]ADH68958.1 Allophanate hydrolase subunit 1 [Nocardiopsis dassonvillei subsp. dassonvillei DSM 43111]NKY81124.1 allophanate hydrolase subunit 1 [Nocardiopsis dassonvillei]VEI89468.1 Sporulation inhibitor kipI [Nocardiopsis dassonvillei]